MRFETPGVGNRVRLRSNPHRNKDDMSHGVGKGQESQAEGTVGEDGVGPAGTETRSSGFHNRLSSSRSSEPGGGQTGLAQSSAGPSDTQSALSCSARAACIPKTTSRSKTAVPYPTTRGGKGRGGPRPGFQTRSHTLNTPLFFF